MSASRYDGTEPNRHHAVDERSSKRPLAALFRLPLAAAAIIIAIAGLFTLASPSPLVDDGGIGRAAAGVAILLLLLLMLLQHRHTRREAAHAEQLAARLVDSDAARRRAEDRHHEVIDVVSDFVWELDAEGRLTFLSARFQELYGYSVNELIGLPLSAVLKLIGASPASPADRVDPRSTEPLRDVTFSFTDPSGLRRHARLDARPRRDASGNYIGYLGTGRDETELVKAAAAVADIQNRIAAALDAMQEGFSYFDQDDRLLLTNLRNPEMNPSIGDLLTPGTDFASIVRASVERGLYVLGDRTPEAFIAERLARHRDPQGGFELQLTDGRWLLVNERRTADGGTVLLETDVTAIKRAEQQFRDSEGRFRSFITNIHGMLFFRHAAGEPTVHIFGSHAATLVGTVLEGGQANLAAWRAAIHPADLPRHDEGLRRRNELGEPFLTEFRFVHPVTGELKWMLERSWRVEDAETGLHYYDGYILDITERKATEERLLSARESAELANRTKTEFLANMSHELRTPLNAIIGFSDIMQNEMFGSLGSAQYRDYVKDIHDSGQHLLAVIQDILDVAKAEAGKLDLDESDVDVLAVITATLRMVQERAQRGGVLLAQQLPIEFPAVRGDARKIKQILLNLLSNAVKFTPSGGTVSITAQLDVAGSLMLSVVDTGIGIAANDIPRALEPFVQLEAGFGRKYEGSGLGLPLCKALTELHGGSLDIQSDVGRGTTVSVRLPAHRIRIPQVQANVVKLQPIGAPNRPLRLLCIDDDPKVAKLLQALIIGLQWETEFLWADNGAAGIGRVRDWQPDMILLDLRMPGWDGLTILDKLAADQQSRRVPVVVLSAMSLDQRTQTSLQTKGIGMLNKGDLSTGTLKAVLAASLPTLAAAS